MRLALVLSVVGTLAACDVGKFTVNTTSKVLKRGQPSLQMEADYEMARQAIPGALKTVESFWVVDPDNKRLRDILMEGYCQYGTAFVEDDLEVAKFKQDLENVAYHKARATKIFTRCLNYALMALGDRWKKDMFADVETVKKLLASTSSKKRMYMMFAGLALGSIVNHNLTRIEMLGYLPNVRAIIDHVIELDKKSPPSNKQHHALPYVALGMIFTAASRDFGGSPENAEVAFRKALEVTDNKFLLARTLMAYRVGVAKNDQKFFHDELKTVLETAPSVWPEQRLANEVAHRRARRYLSKEKELFQ